MSDAAEKPDYRSTVFLPKTDFPMKAGLPQKEPGILARWQAEGLYQRLREARAGRDKFILHDGPPYANGDIHVGHALNHILKDMVVRTQSLAGKDAPYVPGWDCHGLPIEWKVEEQYRKKKLNKDDVPVDEFRAECRAYARHWVDVQREQLKRLGINGDWDNPYLTMDFDAEATIVGELLKFAESGQLYRGAKPVMWSPVEKTALAEAEVEYEDIVSTQVDVAFEITDSPVEALKGAYAVIWTTTPWTIPVNQAIAYGAEVEYVLVGLDADATKNDAEWTRELGAQSDEQIHLERAAQGAVGGKLYLVAEPLLAQFVARLEKSVGVGVCPSAIMKLQGSDLAGTVARHPIYNLLRLSRADGNPSHGTDGGLNGDMDPGLRRGDGLSDADWERALEFYARPRPFLDGSAFVTTESGTGLVHMAPDHGEDDFDLCKAHGIEPVFAVEGDGKYRADWAWLGGQGSVINPKFNAPDGPICTDLKQAGGLLAASADYKHSYPHSWRSKAKVIYRCTPQWFVPMDRPLTHLPAKTPAEKRWESEGGAIDPADESLCASPTLREAALAEIERVRWVPEKGENRIRSMVDGRPDWVLSRQRAWGVPITLFVHRGTGQYLIDQGVNTRIKAAIREGGVDAWCDARAQEYLGADYRAEDYERVTDILDVWFDSGSTHAFVLESGKWPDLVRPAGFEGSPADLYLEGSDQHRGWFQSSLLESCATRGRAPYDAVLTHGFTMDAKGMKMSKSLGNTVDPIKVMETNGADIIRLWALSVDFTEDHRIGDEILKGVADQYRKLRNTFRYLLGALDGFTEAARVADVAAMPELERYVLALLARLDANLRQAVADYDFNTYVRALTDFCNEDLSAFFFDIRKDCLYCDAADDPKRRAYRTVLDTLFHALVRYAAPVLVFTAEEVWGTRYPDAGSVHLLEWPQLPDLVTPAQAGVHQASGAGGEMDSRLRGNDELVEKWDRLRAYRSDVTEAIEPLRREKLVGSSLAAEVEIDIFRDEDTSALQSINLGEIFISGEVRLVDEVASNYVPGRSSEARIVTKPTTHHKCGRCWRHLPEVAEDGALCSRCDHVVAGMNAPA
jgi:isoleucyl-tRNA synthetase